MENKREIESARKTSRKSLSPDKDDSLADFKSPKEKHVAPVKVKIINDKKAKKNSSKSKTASGKKKEAAKEDAQPSIESSFFKAAINARRDGHTCPLCMKYFADTAAGVSHTKNCASRNKVSTKKLLAAVALQERQAGERIAIGLPAGPIVIPKDKTPRRPRETAAKGDADLQLAIALSKSLQENQLEQEFEEALLLAGEHRGDGKIVGFSSDSERRSTLQNFGFLTNKSAGVSEGPVRARRKKHLGPTILQTRSQEARDRLLTQRIAEILMGNEAITQICQQEDSAKVEAVEKKRIVLRSRLLQEIHRTTERLWDRAELSAAVTNFYVEDLGPIIVAVPQKEDNPESVENARKDNSEEASGSSELSPIKGGSKLSKKMSSSSLELQRMNSEGTYRSESPGLKNIHITDREYRNSLPIDWANILNISSISDVVVLLENGHIWAHKLVFHVRCSDILLDCETNTFSHVKETISWPDVDLSTGLAFLEFVYSGLIEKNVRVFSDDRVARGVRRLARKYRLKALFDYLRRKKTDVFDNGAEVAEDRKSGSRSPVVIEVPATPSDVKTDQESGSANKAENFEINSNILPNSSDFSRSETISDKKPSENDSESLNCDAVSVISVNSSCSRVSMSPDLFDETTEEAPVETAQDSAGIAENPELSDDDNANLRVLADLMAQDDLSSEASTVVEDAISEDRSLGNRARILSLSQGHAETPKSSNSATRLIERSRSQLFPVKQKSNLSLFIEKVQKINAKGALDSSDEGESLAEFAAPKRRRNPFNVNQVADKSILNSNEKLEIKRKLCRDEKRGLSVFDEPIESKGTSEEDDLRENAEKTLLADESSVFDDTDEEDVSMYSKYRKNHKDNSINNYRNGLKKLANFGDDTRDNSTNKENEKSPSGEKADNLTVEKSIDLTQESDTDGDNPPSPISNASRTSQRKSDAEDAHSIQSASTAIANHSDLDASADEFDDLETENIETRASSSKNSGKGKTYSAIESPSPETNTRGTSQCPNSVDSENKVPEYCIESTPESVESPRKSPPPSYHLLLDEDNEIFNHSWKTPERSPKSPAGKLNSSSERKRKSRGNGINSSSENSGRETNVAHSLGNSSKFPDLDVFEIDEEAFDSPKKSPLSEPFRLFPQKSFDYTDKSASSRRKRRAEEKRAKSGHSQANTSGNTSDVDVDELFTQSLRNTVDISRRSLTPERNRRSDSPEKPASSGPKRRSNGGEKNKSQSISPGKSPEFHYEVFEPDDRVFTQFNYSPLPSFRTYSPLPSFDFPDENCQPDSTLKVPSPIVISSSPEIEAEINGCNDEGDCNKENTFSEERTSALALRKSTENPPKTNPPTNPRRPTSPQPGTSRYSNYRENLKSSAKTPLVRWNSMPTSSNVTRKPSRTPKKSPRHAMSQQDVTPPVNYDVMDTPELTKELSRWGMKAQSRKRARKLLNHIYNELHAAREEIDSDDHIDLSEEDEAPARKVSKPGKHTSDDSDSDTEVPASQQSTASPTSPVPEEMDFGDDNASPDNLDESASTSSIKKAFHALIKDDKELHNQILTYEPLSLELLLLMLKERGLKCQSKDLMDFLDEECITFQVQTNQRNRTKKGRGKKTAPGGKGKAFTQKN